MKYQAWLLILLTASSALPQAQISNLSIHPTGNAVYFSTRLSPKGQPRQPGLALFEFKDNRFRILSGPDRSTIPVFPVVEYSIVFSATGSVTAINTRNSCIGGSSCFLRVNNPRTSITSPTQSLTFDGGASLSPNGRFAALYGSTSTDPFNPISEITLRRLDLATGQVVGLGRQTPSGGQLITDNGTILIATATGLRLIGPTQSKDLTPARPPRRPSLNNEATRIVYETSEAPFEIRMIDIATGLDQPLFTGSNPTLALDGRTLTYLNSARQISIADLATGSTRPLSTESESIIEQTISSSGTTVAAITQSSRVLSINTTTAEVTQLLDAPPQPATLFTGMVPGSYNELIGSFPEDSGPYLKLSNQPDPIFLGRTAKGIAFQIPWEAKPDEESVLSFSAKDSPWDSPVLRSVQTTSARILPIDDTSIAIHEDWSGPINTSSPARQSTYSAPATALSTAPSNPANPHPQTGSTA